MHSFKDLREAKTRFESGCYDHVYTAVFVKSCYYDPENPNNIVFEFEDYDRENTYTLTFPTCEYNTYYCNFDNSVYHYYNSYYNTFLINENSVIEEIASWVKYEREEKEKELREEQLRQQNKQKTEYDKINKMINGKINSLLNSLVSTVFNDSSDYSFSDCDFMYYVEKAKSIISDNIKNLVKIGCATAFDFVVDKIKNGAFGKIEMLSSLFNFAKA